MPKGPSSKVIKQSAQSSAKAKNNVDAPSTNKQVNDPLPKKSSTDEDEDSVSESSSGDENSSASDSEKDLLCIPNEHVMESTFLDELIIRLMNAPIQQDVKMKSTGKKKEEFAHIVPVRLDYEELERLCDMAIQSFMKQSSLLVIDHKQLPITIVGDIHGQFKDLRGIFHRCGAPSIQTYLFLGDYVDRGIQGIEVFSLLLALKIKYPTKIYMLRGNHEDANTCASYGFFDECTQRFAGQDKGEKLWRKFVHVFNWIPLAAMVNQSIFCMHGGLSPDLDSPEAIANIQRPSIVPPCGLMCDLVWSDPNDEHLDGWSMNSRGISVSFSEQVIEKFCQRNHIDLIVRGHQLTREMLKSGYRFYAKGRLLTIFSAPNYLNMKNSSCVLKVSKKMKCKFVVFKVYRPKKSKN